MRATLQSSLSIPAPLSTNGNRTRSTSIPSESQKNSRKSRSLSIPGVKWSIPNFFLNGLKRLSLSSSSNSSYQSVTDILSFKLQITDEFQNQTISNASSSYKSLRSCNCSSSKCSKLNCECSSDNLLCVDCNCSSSFNFLDHKDEKKNAIKEYLEHYPLPSDRKIKVLKQVEEKKDHSKQNDENKAMKNKKSNGLENLKPFDPESNNDLYNKEEKSKNKLIEHIDHYEITIDYVPFEQDQISIEFNKFKNKIEISGFALIEHDDKIVIDKILLRCFQLSRDVNTSLITSLLTSDKQLILLFPKL